MDLKMNFSDDELEFIGAGKWFSIGSLDKDGEIRFEMYNMDSTVTFYLTQMEIQEVIRHLENQIKTN